MNIDMAYLLLILGCAAVTFLPRVLPFALVRNLKLPQSFLKWLSYIPICLMSALLVQGVIRETGSAPAVNLPDLLVLLLTLLIAIKTKSLLITVLSGVVLAALVRWIMLI